MIKLTITAKVTEFKDLILRERIKLTDTNLNGKIANRYNFLDIIVHLETTTEHGFGRLHLMHLSYKDKDILAYSCQPIIGDPIKSTADKDLLQNTVAMIADFLYLESRIMSVTDMPGVLNTFYSYSNPTQIIEQYALMLEYMIKRYSDIIIVELLSEDEGEGVVAIEFYV